MEEAKRILDPARRKELYTEAWNIVNVELPHFHLHELTMTSAAAKEVKGYQPRVVGPLHTAEAAFARRLSRRNTVPVPSRVERGEGKG